MGAAALLRGVCLDHSYDQECSDGMGSAKLIHIAVWHFMTRSMFLVCFLSTIFRIYWCLDAIINAF